jgi:hypothetical protein
MSEKKWASVMSSISLILDLHAKQMEVLEQLIVILMDEGDQKCSENQPNSIGQLMQPSTETANHRNR